METAAMASESWVNESLYAEWGQRFLLKRELAACAATSRTS
jgi:hypothetical protein